jgi:hypothetical protein
LFEAGAELESVYRAFRNPKVTLDSLLVRHTERTVARAVQSNQPLVLHDTTECVFDSAGSCEDLFEIRPGTFGLYVHASLVVTGDGRREALGVAAVEILESAKGNRDRWLRQMRFVEAKFPQRGLVTHVMDREGDVYSVIASAVEEEMAFVIRARHDRILADLDSQQRTLLQEVASHDDIVEREVPISERRASALTSLPDQKAKRPPRNSRMARLAVRSCPVTVVKPPRQAEALPASVTINVILVREIEPPAGVEAVEWILLTNRPAKTRAEVLRIVDVYRARWAVEDFFKALKTGCQYENRQLESFKTLTTALGFFIPIAADLLRMRSLATDSEAPASAALDAAELAALNALIASRGRPKLPKTASASEVLYAVARIGGHIKQNGSPGWQVLWRGYRKIVDALEHHAALKDAGL